MSTLTLLRHAKASRDGSVRDDFDRPLARRGREDAPRMAGFLAQQKLVPDLILCSGARRTRETLALVLEGLEGASPKVVFDDALYLATPTAMLARIRKVKPKVGHVMVIGHNPGLQALALDLVGQGDRGDIVALASKLPTCGLVVIELDVESWAGVRPAEGQLRLYVTPKRLAA